jgi:two-component system sensor histidine kinase FlrB
MNQPRPGAPEGVLVEAFNAFMATAGRMESSYGQLQNEVARLRRELEERNAELALSLAQNKQIRQALRRILDSLPCGVLVIGSEDGGIVLMNPEARRLAEVDAEVGPSWTDLPPRIQAILKSAKDRSDEHEFETGTGKAARWLSVRKSTVQVETLDACEEEQSILILRDVTARKEAELQREESRNLVALGEMSAVLAHEIRNPLSSMELWAGLLAKQPAVGEETSHCVEHLQAGVRSLAATVNNVLQLHGNGPGKHEPLRLMSVLQSGVAFVRPLADQAGIKIKLQSESSNVEITGDANGLQQVILNLSINSFRHTPMGGSLTISVRQKQAGGTVVVNFSDTGKGIPAADVPKLFDAGFSGDGRGPGLGLTICQRIIQQHGGTIGVSSMVGKGTTFSLEFPVL